MGKIYCVICLKYSYIMRFNRHHYGTHISFEYDRINIKN